MSSELPPTDPRAGDLARKKALLTILCIAIAISSLLILILPLPVSLPIKLVVVFTDLVVAATIWLVARQKFSGK